MSSDTYSIYNLESHSQPSTSPFSVGIHPWDVKTDSNNSHLLKLLSLPQCVAIGETGLDKLYSDTFELQKVFFKEHLTLSMEYEKPIIIHNVKASSDILSILKKSKFNQAVLLHDYNGNTETTKQFLNFNTFFSYGKKLFSPNSTAYKNIHSIPEDRLLFETDDLNIRIQEVYQEASKILNITIEQLVMKTKNNFTQFMKRIDR